MLGRSTQSVEKSASRKKRIDAAIVVGDHSLYDAGGRDKLTGLTGPDAREEQVNVRFDRKDPADEGRTGSHPKTRLPVRSLGQVIATVAQRSIDPNDLDESLRTGDAHRGIVSFVQSR